MKSLNEMAQPVKKILFIALQILMLAVGFYLFSYSKVTGLMIIAVAIYSLLYIVI